MKADLALTTATEAGLPEGWCLALDSSSRRLDQGRALIGGAPMRVLRMSPAGARWLDRMVDGGPLAASLAERQLALRLTDAGLAHPRPSAGAGPRLDDVAVVIPVRDMAAGLARTLDSLRAVDTAGAVGEVLVVDDGSRDPDALRAAAGDARVLRNERSLGPAAARERGWRATSRPIVAFVDAEVEATDTADWLTSLLAHLGDDTVGAVAPRVRAARGDAPDLLARYERASSSLDRGPRAGAVRPGGAVPYVPTTALVVRRDALESIGGFDPGLHVGEDVDLVWRLHEHGWRVRYDPTVEVTHPSRSTWGGWLRQRVAYGTSAAPLARRHGRAAAPLAVSRRTASTLAAVLLGQPLVGAAMAGARTARLAHDLQSLDHALRESARIAARELLGVTRWTATAVRGPWWPLAVGLAVCSRRSRPTLLAAVVVPPLLDALEQRPHMDPVRFGVLRLADDVAYGVGVWIGCGRERSMRALLPVFS